MQGRSSRWKVGILPDAAGEKKGKVGDDRDPAKLFVIGESTVAGLGARTHELALAGQFAKQLSEQIGRTVEWKVLGKNGVTAGGPSTSLSRRCRKGHSITFSFETRRQRCNEALKSRQMAEGYDRITRHLASEEPLRRSSFLFKLSDDRLLADHAAADQNDPLGNCRIDA